MKRHLGAAASADGSPISLETSHILRKHCMGKGVRNGNFCLHLALLKYMLIWGRDKEIHVRFFQKSAALPRGHEPF